MGSKKTGLYMRVVHRYLGFFLAGIMAMYAISGVVLIFRNTDFLKQEKQIEKVIEKDVQPDELGEKLKIKRLKVTQSEGGILYFKDGTYNQATGEAQYSVKKLPLLLDKMTHLHKAKSGEPLYWLNILFGFALFFFVISSFWMFRPSTSIFKKGMYFALGGIVLTVVLLFV
ncbi:MAG: hypothetical protein AAF135_17090 [Bacteroidota bacterium]